MIYIVVAIIANHITVVHRKSFLPNRDAGMQSARRKVLPELPVQLFLPT